MQRYFVKHFDYDEEQKHYSDTFSLSMEDSYHLTKVMRANNGDLVEIVCDDEVFCCEIVSQDPVVKCCIKEKMISDQCYIPKVTIAQSLVKEQKMDYILQKTTELGVDKIIPVIANRSVVKLNDKREKKIARWQTIVKEASEQSKRKNIPSVLNFHNIENLIDLNYDHKILCTVNEVSTTLKTVLQNVNNDDTILVVIGPEGGFTKEEERILIESGFVSTSLGNRVLRTETASLFLLSIINYIYMR